MRLLTDEEIKQMIKADKHRKYNVSVTITPRDFVIAQAQAELTRKERDKEWVEWLENMAFQEKNYWVWGQRFLISDEFEALKQGS